MQILRPFFYILAALPLPAANITATVAQSTSVGTGTTAIDLTADGDTDWGIWQNTNRSLTNRMDGGSEFDVLSLLGAATDTWLIFPNPQNSYNWTNGTPTTMGSNVTQGARAELHSNGDGVRLTIDVATAGAYQLKYYTTTFDVNLDATASLATGGVSDTAVGTYAPNALEKYKYTVDFVTDGADTLTVDLVKNGGSNNVLSFEAFSLKTVSGNPDPNLAIDPSFLFSNDGTPESFQIAYNNSGTGGPVRVTSITPGGADASYFSIDSFTTPVAARGSGAIRFTFDPTDGNRSYNATLTIASDDPDSPSTVIDITVQSSVLSLGKIVCIGDSITEANALRTAGDGNWSWRYAFWKHLVDANVAHEFVGTRTANHSGASVYPDYNGQAFVNRHEAIWGFSAQERASSATTYLGNLKSQGDTPDTAIIFCGCNDVPVNLNVSAATVRDRIGTIVDNLQGDIGANGNPDVRILLVSIIPRFTGGGTTPDVRNGRYQEINNLLATLATTETTATSTVSYVDIFPLFNSPPGLLYDGIHPNGDGEQVLADQIFAALRPVPSIIDIALEVSGDVVLTLDGSVVGLTVQQSKDLAPGSFSDVPSTPGANTLTIDAIDVDPEMDGKDFYRVRN